MSAYTDAQLQHVTIARSNTLSWERGVFGYQATGIAFTADSKYVAIWGGSDNNSVNMYDVDNGNLVAPLSWATNSARGITFSPDGRWALVFDSYDSGAGDGKPNLAQQRLF